MVNYKTLVAASLMSMALTSSAFAQCTECAIYPERDPLNKGAQTPAAKMGLVQPGGAATPPDVLKTMNDPNNPNNPNNLNNPNNPNNARAEMRAGDSQRSHREIGAKKEIGATKKASRNPDNMSR